MLPEQLLRDVEQLRADGHDVDVLDGDGWAYVIFHEYPLPPRYSRSTTELLIKIPISYPNGKPDMFWTDPDVTLSDGSIPQAAQKLEDAVGRQWRRFSWHAQNWNPGTDDIRTFLEFVNNRLAKAQ